MATTPKGKSKLSYKNLTMKTDLKKEKDYAPQSLMNTPISNKSLPPEGDDFSPVYFPSTQESNEEIDVLWDWHSPQTSQRKRKKQKRLLPVQSPKVPMKRYPSNNENFERLKNELKALQEELAMPDDESCLCISPQQETDFKESQNKLTLPSEPKVDLFDDSMDEQLVLFSQQIETQLLGTNVETNKKSQSNFEYNTSEIDNLVKEYEKENDIFEDSFDKALGSFSLENIRERLGDTKTSLQKSHSDNNFNKSKQNILETVSGKLEIHRTRSFEMTKTDTGQSNLPRSTLEEIERKRLEALAKLKSKQKQENTINKCSPEEIERKRLEALAKLEAKRIQDIEKKRQEVPPEEIERKRLEALAKLEAKRIQDIIEKKRQEALKKLQMRKQNASQVKSTLATRL